MDREWSPWILITTVYTFSINHPVGTTVLSYRLVFSSLSFFSVEIPSNTTLYPGSGSLSFTETLLSTDKVRYLLGIVFSRRVKCVGASEFQCILTEKPHDFYFYQVSYVVS